MNYNKAELCKDCKQPVVKRKWPRLGRVVMTRGIEAKINPESFTGRSGPTRFSLGGRSARFKADVQRAMSQYKRGNWAKTDSQDKKMNDWAAEGGESRILAVYPTVEGDIWIITERDRSATTILFPNEY